jgi:prephenate dehydrogenase
MNLPSQISSIGIIGNGRFGKLLYKIFTEHWPEKKVSMYARSQAPDGETFVSLEAVCQCDVVIPCMPMSAFEDILKMMQLLVAPSSTVIGICSVQVVPTEWMQKYLGDRCKLIATHPMFGPEGTKNGTKLDGLKMMAHNISADQSVYDEYFNFWKKLSIEVLEMTPDEHDKYAAYTMNFNHILGRMAGDIGFASTPVDTMGTTMMLTALSYVNSCSEELFYDMQRLNPYAGEMIDNVIESLVRIRKEIENENEELRIEN